MILKPIKLDRDISPTNIKNKASEKIYEYEITVVQKTNYFYFQFTGFNGTELEIDCKLEGFRPIYLIIIFGIVLLLIILIIIVVFIIKCYLKPKTNIIDNDDESKDFMPRDYSNNN